MTQSSTSPIYLVADLIDARLFSFPEGATLEQSYGDAARIRDGEGRQWGYDFTCRDFTSPVAVAAKLRQILSPRTTQLTPAIDAEALGRKIRDRWPLTAAQLLYEPEFAKLARQAAEADRAYTQDLLAWEKKAVVIEAVAIVRQQVEAERAAERQRQAELAAQRQAKLERERPTRDAVLAAYESCDYRTARQGHETRVVILPGATDSLLGKDHPGVSSDTSKGDRYSSRCTWKKTESTHTIRVRADWLERVAGRGLETFDGRLVVDAVEVGHTADLSRIVLRLQTVRQGRGTALECEAVEVVYDGFDCERLAKTEAVVAYEDERIAHDALIDAGLIAG